MRIVFLTEPFIIEPLGMGYLAAVLKHNGYEPYLLQVPSTSDCTALYQQLERINPLFVAVSATTGKHRKYLEVLKKIKARYQVFSIMGGAHPTYHPEVINEPYVDFIVRGEGEKSFVKLLQRVELVKSVKKVIEFDKLEQSLDKIPFPDREFLYTFPENRNNPIKNIITSRGCPYNCSYCFNSLYRKFYGEQKWVRFRSAENVVQECEELLRYPLKLIYFQDDCFGASMEWLKEFSQKYSDRVGMPFHCQIRVEQMCEERLKLLKEAGCTGVTFAVESGCERVRRDVLNRNYDTEGILRGVTLLKKYGLKFRVENMCGIPTETVDEMMSTYTLNKQIKGIYNWISIFQPYTGLRLSDWAKQEGLWDGCDKDVKETFFEDSILNFTEKRKRIIKNFQTLFGIGVRLNLPNWLFRFLIRLPSNKFYNFLAQRFKNKEYRKLYGI